LRTAVAAIAAAALLLPASTAASDKLSLAVVRVPVANVWAARGTPTLPADPHLWPTARVSYSQRLALVGHMPTQVLYGERVRVLARRDAWTQIAVPDQPSPLDRRGYPGWVLTKQLTRTPPSPHGTVTVTSRTAKLLDGVEVSFATELPLVRRAGKLVAVSTPDGGTWIRAKDVAPLPRTRTDIVRSAKMFIGLPYLWGGLSSWGMDCSGLTWAAYRAHGITIPRDADAQYSAGTPVSLAQARPGDLLFYEPPSIGHVAMYLGNGLMIESPNSRSQVRIVPVRTGDFAGVRSFLG
jgi:cell wall-associated NlpC family hydrolase